MNRIPFKITAIYILMGIAWVWGSDRLVLSINSSMNVEHMTYIQNTKGFLFVLLSSLLFFFLVKKSYMGLQKSESWYRELFNESPIPKVVYNHESFQVLDANKAACRQYGYTREEFLKLSLSHLFPEPKGSTHEWIQQLQTENNRPVVALHKKKDGTQFFTKSHPSVTVHNGKPARLVDLLDENDKILAEHRRKVADKKLEEQNYQLKQIA